ncbi:type VI secretion system-associated protein TagF [Piscinibacter sp.]|uniref:type VI secretion system-associated protein TagF n=1 Tax=Piscinibacter sp. TaxID=1903157 RepID=UPI0035599859
MSETAVSLSPGLHSVPGWFGKMPNLGDFVSRRLPDDFIRDWDDWLQHGLANARTELGADWLARYLVAPVRRFWLAPGVLGHAGWAGVLMPSVDSVGRHFPLTIAAAIGQPARSLAPVLAARDWFGAIDAAARKVLDVQFSPDDLEFELTLVGPLPTDAAGDSEAQGLADAVLGPYLRAEPEFGTDGLRPCSVWWCGDAVQPSQFDSFAALPPASSFAALLADPGTAGARSITADSP